MCKKKTILFLEDELEFLTTLSQLFRDQGYDVIEVTSAETAIKKLSELIPDLILADIKLPGIDGFDFFSQIREIEEYKNIPFIYLTAFNNLQAAMRAKNEGAVDYITKPFELEYLITRVQEILPLT
ncbi:MAG: response regulator [Bacteroidota bacterium]|nr:response regulator [Bacteroidota bacterium]